MEQLQSSPPFARTPAGAYVYPYQFSIGDSGRSAAIHEVNVHNIDRGKIIVSVRVRSPPVCRVGSGSPGRSTANNFQLTMR